MNTGGPARGMGGHMDRRGHRSKESKSNQRKGQERPSRSHGGTTFPQFRVTLALHAPVVKPRKEVREGDLPSVLIVPTLCEKFVREHVTALGATSHRTLQHPSLAQPWP